MNHALDRAISPGMLVRFSLPTILSTVFMGIYSTVDGIFVSRLVGTDALSAVNIIMPLITVSLAIGAMFGAGGNAIVARKLGEKKEGEARRNFSLLVVVAFLASVLLSLLGLLFLEQLIGLLGADDALFPYCREYAIPTLLFLPFTIFGMIFQMSFITVGRANLGMAVSILGGVSNVVLDYLLIAVFDMGIAGAAIATGIGYSLPALIGFFYFLLRRKGGLFLVKPAWDGSVLWRSCSNGASEMVTNLAMGVVTLLLNNILMRLAGSDGVASVTIILYAQGVLGSAYMGYAMGVAPVISYNYGKQDTDRLKKIYSISLRIILTVSVVTFALSLIFAQALVGIFAPEGTGVYHMAIRGFRMFSVCFLFMGFNVFGSAMFTALSNGKVSAILSFFRTLVFIVVAALTFPLFLGIDGVWIAIPSAEFLGICMTFYYFKKMKKVYHYA